MRKPRAEKSPLALWVADNTRRLGMTPLDVARRLDVAESTVRGWESGRGVSERYLADLERIFGTPVPSPEQPPDQAAVVTELRDLFREQRDMIAQQNALLVTLLGELRLYATTSQGQHEGLRDVLARVEAALPDLDTAPRSEPAPNAEARP